VIGFDEAVTVVAAAAKPLGSERVAIGEAHRRVLAGDICAAVDAPPSNVSAMDGYAVREGDIQAVPARLRVIGESWAGRSYPGSIGAGECVRIFTGAAVPAGADRVVVQEMARREGDEVVVEAKPGTARHVRTRGSDFAEGELLLPAGRLLDHRALVAAAGADAASLSVWRRPRLALLAAGDELAEPGSARGSNERIPESVSAGVLALASDWGAEPLSRTLVPDDLATMARAAEEAVAGADLIVVTGGASVGERDFARAMFAPMGLELLFSKVAIRPGKPVWLGRVDGTLVLGLPGNPGSALVTARLFLAPLVAGMVGRDPAEALRWRGIALAAALPACGERETFFRARSTGAGAVPAANQDSGAQSILAASDLLLRRAAHAPAVAAGECVDALDF
jgi:molybdopterin molybdotransferase